MSEENEVQEQKLIVEVQNEDPVMDAPVQVKVFRYVPDDLVALYSDSMTVLHTQNEFILSFFLSHYPAAETSKELQEVKMVKSRCIAQIVVNPVQMEKIIHALQINIEKFKSNKNGE